VAISKQRNHDRQELNENFFRIKSIRSRENSVPMEDKKREGSLPRTLAPPKSSLENLVNGLLHVFVSTPCISILWLWNIEYYLKEEHEK